MKKLRNLVVVMCLMLCTVMLVACGGAEAQLKTEASVSKKGYVAATKDDLTTFQTTNPEVKTDSLKSLRFTMKVKKTVLGTTTETIMNYIITTDANNKVNGIALKMTSGDKISLTAYYKDGNQYLNLVNGENKLKYTSAVNVNDETEGETNGGILDMSMVQKELKGTLDQFAALADQIGGEGVTFEKAVKGNNTRFHLGTTAKEMTTNTYFEFDEANLIGFEFSMTGETYGEMSMALCGFNGKIKYPSFKGYEKVDSTTIDKAMDGIIGLLGM